MTKATSTRRAAPPKTLPRAAKAAAGRTEITETPVAIRGAGVALADELQAHVRRTMGRKLGKFALSITRISVRFESVAGDRNRPAIVCRIKAVLPALASVIVESSDGDIRAAFDNTADAHERAVRRLLEKSARSSKRS